VRPSRSTSHKNNFARVSGGQHRNRQSVRVGTTKFGLLGTAHFALGGRSLRVQLASRAAFLFCLPREPQLPQLSSSITEFLLGRIIICCRLWCVGSLRRPIFFLRQPSRPNTPKCGGSTAGGATKSVTCTGGNGGHLRWRMQSWRRSHVLVHWHRLHRFTTKSWCGWQASS
jgi:hypothetical protein